jgi:hypothetical protein
LRTPSPAIDGAGSGPDGFGVDPAEIIESYIVEVMCRVRAGAACGRGGESNRINPDGAGNWRGMVRGTK